MTCFSINGKFIREKNTKSWKKGEIITYQPKNFEKSSIYDMKSVITEHPKTSHKLFMTIVQTGKVVSNSCLYSFTKNNKKLLNKNL